MTECALYFASLSFLRRSGRVSGRTSDTDTRNLKPSLGRATHSIDNLACILRYHIPTPRYVPVRTNQNQWALVGISYLGRVQRNNLKRQADLPRGNRKRRGIDDLRRQNQQRKTFAEKVECGSAVFEPYVRRAAAGPRGRHIKAVVESRRRGPVRDTNRRILVTIAKLDADGVMLKFLGTNSENGRTRFLPELSSFFAVFLEERRERDLSIGPSMHFSCLVYIGHADGTPLRSVAIQQPGTAPT